MINVGSVGFGEEISLALFKYLKIKYNIEPFIGKQSMNQWMNFIPKLAYLGFLLEFWYLNLYISLKYHLHTRFIKKRFHYLDSS